MFILLFTVSISRALGIGDIWFEMNSNSHYRLCVHRTLIGPLQANAHRGTRINNQKNTACEKRCSSMATHKPSCVAGKVWTRRPWQGTMNRPQHTRIASQLLRSNPMTFAHLRALYRIFGTSSGDVLAVSAIYLEK